MTIYDSPDKVYDPCVPALSVLPDGLTWPLLLLAAGGFVAGGLIKGLAGFGLPLITISLLSTLLPVEVALGLNVVPPVLLNLWQAGGRRGVRRTWRRFWPVLVAMPLGVAVGGVFAARLDPRWLLAAVGLTAVVFCAVQLAGIRLRFAPAHVKPAGFASGMAAGLIGALTSVGGPPLIMYLMAVRITPQAFKAALGLFFVLAGILMMLAFYTVGFLTPTLAVLGAAMTAPAALGMWLGRQLARRVDPATFRMVALALLALLGLNLLRRAFFG